MSEPLSILLETAWRPAVNPWVIALTVTLATFMEVLDTSIAVLLMIPFVFLMRRGKPGGMIWVH